jgi:hypothetical protein
MQPLLNQVQRSVEMEKRAGLELTANIGAKAKNG